MKRLLLLIVGILLLWIGITMSSNAGYRLGGGTQNKTIPIGTITIDYSVTGK